MASKNYLYIYSQGYTLISYIWIKSKKPLDSLHQWDLSLDTESQSSDSSQSAI